MRNGNLLSCIFTTGMYCVSHSAWHVSSGAFFQQALNDEMYCQVCAGLGHGCYATRVLLLAVADSHIPVSQISLTSVT